MLCRVTLIAAVLAVASAHASPQAGHEGHKPTDMSFVAFAVTDVRDGPKASAKVVRRLQPFEVVMAYDAVPGWVHVDLLADTDPSSGWVRASTMDDVISASWLDLRLKVQTLTAKAWPFAAKRDILRQRPRVGFSKQQVELAIGIPVSIRTTETKAGERARWVYRHRVVTFAGDRVVEVEQTSTP